MQDLRDIMENVVRDVRLVMTTVNKHSAVLATIVEKVKKIEAATTAGSTSNVSTQVSAVATQDQPTISLNQTLELLTKVLQASPPWTRGGETAGMHAHMYLDVLRIFMWN